MPREYRNLLWRMPLLCGGLVVASYLPGQAVEGAAGGRLGMSSGRLLRARDVLQHAVASHTVGSAVGLVARSGKVLFLESAGEAGPGVPMTVDAIARLASITKPITAVAVLMLWEQGRLDLQDRVDTYIPEFSDVRVAVPGGDGARPRLVQPERAITIHDLLTHQAGLVPDGAPELDEIWGEARTVLDFSVRVAAAPLRFQPGTRFEYGPAYEVLTAIIEKITAQSYAKFLTENVLQPLRMTDTYFFVPPEKRQRLAAQYMKDPTGALAMFRARGQEETPSEFYSGGGGLRSTVRDYYRFAQLLLNEGELDGVRLLSPRTVRLMVADQVGSKYGDDHYGWGLGVEVRTSPAGAELGSVASFGWNGGTGTLFVVDPREHLIVVVFAPTTPGTPGVNAVRRSFVTAAYQAVSTSYDRSPTGPERP
jgi:CubicO group peptidase (beta-lactamase class C family)